MNVRKPCWDTIPGRVFLMRFSPPLRASPPFTPFHPFVNRVGVKVCACIKSSMLGNEKYCGDVLRQKTFTSDCISHKVIRNTGQRDMFLIQNHHEGIVTRETFDAAQAEMARRTARRSPSKKNTTGQSKYSSKYALTERLICGECGTLYRRCTWTAQGRRRIVWRCVSRLDYGKKYCHDSPTVYEGPLHDAIIAAINGAMRQRGQLIGNLKSAMEYEMAPVPGATMSMAEIEQRMETLKDLWLQFDDENIKLHDTLDLLYAMSEAARNEEIDLKRYANALDFVWQRLCSIEKRYALLNESLVAFTNDAQASASMNGGAAGSRVRGKSIRLRKTASVHH